MMHWLLSYKFNGCTLCALAFLSPVLFAASSVSFQRDPNFSAVVQVYLNDSGPYSFLLDTGSGRSLVSLEILKQLKAPYQSKQKLITASGADFVDSYRLDSLRVGDRISRKIDVLGVPMGRGNRIPLAGLLGQDFLQQFDYILDYGRKQLIFEDGNEFKALLDKDVDVYEMQRYARMMLIMLPPQSPRKKPFLLVLDSGISGLILFNQTLDAFGLDLDHRSLEPESLSTILGRDVGLGGIFRSLRFKGSKLKNQKVFIVPASPIYEILIEDGLLPTSFFQSLYVCNSRNMIALNPVLDGSSNSE
jgi:hypothetical protein